MTLRPYTGLTEGYGKGRRPGLEHLAAAIQYLTSGALWNNGTYGIRPSTSDGVSPSVHGTGRAVDLSGRPMGDHRKGCTRAQLEAFSDLFADRADLLGVELVIDYGYVGPEGRGGRVWKCDRDSWRYPLPGQLNGGGQAWGDWLHLEVSPRAADDPAFIDAGLTAILTGKPPAAPASTVTPPRYPGRPLKLGSRGISVGLIQGRLNLKQDQWYGPVTEAAVKAFQKAQGLTVDGITGPITWGALFR